MKGLITRPFWISSCLLENENFVVTPFGTISCNITIRMETIDLCSDDYGCNIPQYIIYCNVLLQRQRIHVPYTSVSSNYQWQNLFNISNQFLNFDSLKFEKLIFLKFQKQFKSSHLETFLNIFLNLGKGYVCPVPVYCQPFASLFTPIQVLDLIFKLNLKASLKKITMKLN